MRSSSLNASLEVSNERPLNGASLAFETVWYASASPATATPPFIRRRWITPSSWRSWWSLKIRTEQFLSTTYSFRQVVVRSVRPLSLRLR